MPALFALFILAWFIWRFGPFVDWLLLGCPGPDDDE
jgi:hypothetical protein